MTKQVELAYSNKYTDLSRGSIIEKVKSMLSEKRFNHVLRVEQTALELAKKFQVDLEKVSIAALTHDIAKEESNDEMRDMIISENMDLEILDYGSNIWHGPVGAILVRKQLRVHDDEILDAIAKHTVGSPQMTAVDKIIYIADFIEPNRDFSEAEKARELAEDSLDRTLGYISQVSLQHLIEKRSTIYPLAVETYNKWSTIKEK